MSFIWITTGEHEDFLHDLSQLHYYYLNQFYVRRTYYKSGPQEAAKNASCDLNVVTFFRNTQIRMPKAREPSGRPTMVWVTT